MAEPHGHGPARVGRKDPELAAAIALDPDTEIGTDEVTEETTADLLPGDVVELKITHEIQHGRGPTSFVSYGIKSRIQMGEDEDTAFERVGNHVLTKLDELLDAAANQYEAFIKDRSTRRIVPND